MEPAITDSQGLSVHWMPVHLAEELPRLPPTRFEEKPTSADDAEVGFFLFGHKEREASTGTTRQR